MTTKETTKKGNRRATKKGTTATTITREARRQAASVQEIIESAPMPDFILSAILNATAAASLRVGVPNIDCGASKAAQRRALTVLFAALPPTFEL
jgi:hypothetical protein